MVLFYLAGKQSGYVKLQLQLAAREAAARQLLDETGLDIRNHLERLTPAVLRANPPVDATGKKYLKNEYENRLYYFLQVTEDDFLTQVSKAFAPQKCAPLLSLLMLVSSFTMGSLKIGI
jgi:hypothetical protein